MEKTVSTLKPLFTETSATFIFVAGRDIDDNWLEDQSKGDGLYESIFTQNVYVPSFLHKEIEKEKGKNQVDENKKKEDELFTAHTKGLVDRLVEGVNDREEVVQNLYEEFCRYLTFKGRGIPRKILREISNFVSWNKVSAELYFTSKDKQRIKFYSELLELIETQVTQFKNSDDRTKVSIFYIIDYILKFYESGFDWNDIEKAPILTEEEGLFLPREIAQKVLTILEGTYLERMIGSKRTYKFSPKIEAEIRTLTNMLDEERVEFRFTYSDFSKAISYYSKLDERLEQTEPQQRITSIRVQMNLGDIYDKLKNYGRAILYYKKAVRLGLEEMKKYIDPNSTATPLITPNINILVNLISQTYNAIGHIHEKQMEYSTAIMCYNQALHLQMRSWEYLTNLNKEQSFLKIMPEIITEEPLIKSKLDEVNKSVIIENMVHNAELSHTLNHIAYAMEKSGDIEKADLYFNFACGVMKSDSDYISLAVQLNRIGDVYFAREELDKAEKMYIAVKKLSETHKEILPLVLAHNYSDLGDVYYAQGYVEENKEKSIEQYDESLAFYQCINYHNDIVSILIRKGKMMCQQKKIKGKGELGKDWEMYVRALHQCRERWIEEEKEKEKEKEKMRFTDKRNYALCMVLFGNLCLKRAVFEQEISGEEKNKLEELGEELKIYMSSIAVINDGKIFYVQGGKKEPSKCIECIGEILNNLNTKSGTKEGLFKLAEICLLIAGRSLMRHVYGLDDAWSARELGRLYYQFSKEKEEKKEKKKMLKEAKNFFEIADELYVNNINDNPLIVWAYADNCADLGNTYLELHKLYKLSSESKQSVAKTANGRKYLDYYKKTFELYLDEINNIHLKKNRLKDKYYMRDDFNNSEEHWSMALLYWIGTERYGKKEKN